MSRRHRHYRKHRNENEATTLIMSDSPTQSTAASGVDDNLGIVRADLTRTAIITVILLIALSLMSAFNAKQGWTLTLGSQLYSFLHIR